MLGFIGARDDDGGWDNWSYKTCKAPVKSSPPTNHQPVFYSPDALPVAQPTVSNKNNNNKKKQQHKPASVLIELTLSTNVSIFSFMRNFVLVFLIIATSCSVLHFYLRTSLGTIAYNLAKNKLLKDAVTTVICNVHVEFSVEIWSIVIRKGKERS